MSGVAGGLYLARGVSVGVILAVIGAALLIVNGFRNPRVGDPYETYSFKWGLLASALFLLGGIAGAIVAVGLFTRQIDATSPDVVASLLVGFVLASFFVGFSGLRSLWFSARHDVSGR